MSGPQLNSIPLEGIPLTETILAASVTSLILGFLGILAYRAAARDPVSDALVLEYSIPLKAISVFAAVVAPPGIAVLAVTIPQQSPLDPYLAGLVYVFYFIGGGALLVETLRVRILLTDDSITGLSPWRPRRSIRWHEIASVRFSPVASWFTIRSTDGRKIRVHTWITGVPSLVRELRARLSPEQYCQAERWFKLLRYRDSS